MPRTELYILTKRFENAVRDCRIPVAKLAPSYGLHVAQVSKALNASPIGPALLARFEALGADLGISPEHIAIKCDGDAFVSGDTL